MPWQWTWQGAIYARSHRTVRARAGKHWTPSQVQSRTSKFLHSYKEKYIDTGSIKPLTDTMIGLFFLSYAVAWPQVELSRPPGMQTAKSGVLHRAFLQIVMELGLFCVSEPCAGLTA